MHAEGKPIKNPTGRHRLVQSAKNGRHHWQERRGVHHRVGVAGVTVSAGLVQERRQAGGVVRDGVDEPEHAGQEARAAHAALL